MKKLLYSMLTILLVSCSQSKYNEGDFANKTFAAQIMLDSSLTNKADGMAAGMITAFLANAKTSYAFKKPPQGIYTASMGMMVSESPFQWAIKDDSLKIVTVNKGKGKIATYKVLDSENGYKLQSDSVSVILTVQPQAK